MCRYSLSQVAYWGLFGSLNHGVCGAPLPEVRINVHTAAPAVKARPAGSLDASGGFRAAARGFFNGSRVDVITNTMDHAICIIANENDCQLI